MVVYCGTVDQMFMIMMTWSATAGLFRKLMPPPSGRMPMLMRMVLMGPVTLNMNMKMMVSAELEVRVGRK